MNKHSRAQHAGQPHSIPNVAVVTGGSRGIGKAVCLALAAKGTCCCVNFTSETSTALAEAVVQECIQLGSKAFAFRADVSIPADVKALFAATESELGAVTGLVNNAAVLGPLTDLLTTSLEDLQRAMAVNVYGVFLCTQEFVRRALVRDPPNEDNDDAATASSNEGRGAIVNVSSGSAFIGRPLAYAMTKGALNSFSAGTVPQLAELGIRLNSVSPGMTKTEMVSDELIAQNMEAIPMKRGAEPSEIANAVVFLLSEEASFVSGGNLRVAGGRRMGSGAQ